jgi:hypothetical protein
MQRWWVYNEGLGQLYKVENWIKISNFLQLNSFIDTGSVKANVREPKSWLGQVFNFTLGCFVMCTIAWPIHARQSLKEWKTRPRFHPFSLSLSMLEIVVNTLGFKALNISCDTEMAVMSSISYLICNKFPWEENLSD